MSYRLSGLCPPGVKTTLSTSIVLPQTRFRTYGDARHEPQRPTDFGRHGRSVTAIRSLLLAPPLRIPATEVRPARLKHRYQREGLERQEQEAFAVCAWLQDRDRLDLLRPYFTPPLSAVEQQRARLEGWVLGVS